MQVALRERDVGDFLGNRGALPHGNADRGRGKRGGIVHPVAHHDYLAALSFQLLHEPVLVLRKQIGAEFGDARRLCDAGGRLLVVARQHDDPLEAEVAQTADRLGDTRLQGIVDADDAHEHTVDGEVERREIARLGIDFALVLVGDDDLLVLDDEVPRPDYRPLAVDRARDAVRYDVLHSSMAFTMLEVLLSRGANNGARDGMREVLFQARREAKDLGPVPSVERDNAFHLGLRLGKRASLVEDDRVGLGECLEMLRPLHREARLGGLAHGGQDRD